MPSTHANEESERKAEIVLIHKLSTVKPRRGLSTIRCSTGNIVGLSRFGKAEGGSRSPLPRRGGSVRSELPWNRIVGVVVQPLRVVVIQPPLVRSEALPIDEIFQFDFVSGGILVKTEKPIQFFSSHNGEPRVITNREIPRTPPLSLQDATNLLNKFHIGIGFGCEDFVNRQDTDLSAAFFFVNGDKKITLNVEQTHDSCLSADSAASVS
jgi:hypothetical protein